MLFDYFTGKKTATEVMAASNDDNSKSFLGKQDSFYESSNKRDSLSVEKKNTIIEKVETVYQNLRLINGRFPTISSHFFCQLHEYLSQNRSSESHFEVQKSFRT